MDKLEKFQNEINKIRVRSSVGGIRKNIATNFSSFTADQFQNWDLVNGVLAEWEALPDKH